MIGYVAIRAITESHDHYVRLISYSDPKTVGAQFVSTLGEEAAWVYDWDLAVDLPQHAEVIEESIRDALEVEQEKYR